MRRVLLILVTAGKLTAVNAADSPAHPDPTPVASHPTTRSSVKVISSQADQPSAVQAAAFASPATTPIQTEGDSHLTRYGTLFATLMAIAAIALRRIRARRS
jgi:hypothetical protein